RDREAEEDPHRRAPRGAGVVRARPGREGMTGVRRARLAPGGPADRCRSPPAMESRGTVGLVRIPPLRKGRLTMRSRVVLFAITLVLVGVMVGWSIAATPKQYQFTGNIVELDAKAKTISVDKNADVLEFSMDGLKDGKLKKGDKVTVFYQMTAKKIEPAK